MCSVRLSFDFSQHKRLVADFKGGLIASDAGLSCGGDGIISGAVIENNVIHGNGKRGASGINMDGVQDSLVVNNVLSTVAPFIALDDWRTRHTLAQWQAMGHERHSFACPVSELFAGAPSGDYHLSARSPAAGKGQVIDDVAADAEGNPRPRAAADIGCYCAAPGGR